MTPDSRHLTATLTREKLLEGLAAVTPALAKQTTLPVLANILFQSTPKGLREPGWEPASSILPSQQPYFFFSWCIMGSGGRSIL